MNRRNGQKWMVIVLVCWLSSTMIITCSDLFAQDAGFGGGGTSYSESIKAAVQQSANHGNPYSGSTMMGGGSPNPKPNTWDLDDQSTVTPYRVVGFIYGNGQLTLEQSGGAKSPTDLVDPFKASKPAGDVSTMKRATATGLRITALLLPEPEAAAITTPSAEAASKPNKSLIVGIDLGTNIRWDGSGRTLFYEPRNATPFVGRGSPYTEGSSPFGNPIGSESERPHFLFRLTTELPRLADESLRNQAPIRELYALSTDERLAIVQSISSGIAVENLRIVFSKWMERGENAKQFEGELRMAMNDQYDANLKLQEIQVKKVEDRVKLLRDEVVKRTTARDRIVGLMMEQISLRAQGLPVDVGVLGFPGLRNESGQGASQVPAGGSNPFPPGNNNPFGPNNPGLADPFK